MAENAVLQSLAASFDVFPRYWVSTGMAEVDFFITFASWEQGRIEKELRLFLRC